MSTKPSQKVIFSCSRIKIGSTTIFLVLKLALKECQRNKFTFSVKKDEECVFSGQRSKVIKCNGPYK